MLFVYQVDRLLQKMHTLFQHADQVDSPASLNLAQEQLDRVITGLRRCTVFVDVAQQRCPHSDFTPYRERCAYTQTHTGRQTDTHSHTHTQTYTHMCAHMHTQQTDAHAHLHPHKNTHTYTHTHTCTHAHQVLSCVCPSCNGSISCSS